MTQQVNLGQGNGNFGPVLATEEVPPGSYTVSSNISFGTIATGDPTHHLISCEVSDANGLAAASDQQLTVPDAYTVTIGLSFADTTHSAGAFEIECFALTASFGQSGELTVTAVGSLHG